MGAGKAELKLFWRDELLQVLYWLHGEGFADLATPAGLAGFLQAEPGLVGECLAELVADGYVEAVAADGQVWYRLTELGRREGGRRFREEFAHLQRTAHYECSPNCTCHITGSREACPSHGAG
ncbi:MAG: hypothetical protein C4316_04375 [Chloroflexota bacterium]